MATTVENLLLFDMGLGNSFDLLILMVEKINWINFFSISGNSFPFIIIPALTGILNQHNLSETLKMTEVEASWLGKRWIYSNCRNNYFWLILILASIGLFFEPIGSILSALITGMMKIRSEARKFINPIRIFVFGFRRVFLRFESNQIKSKKFGSILEFIRHLDYPWPPI